MREFKNDIEKEFEQGIKTALFELARDGEISKIMNIETGEIEYYLPGLAKIDWKKYKKIEY